MYVEAVESDRAGLSPKKKGDVRKKRRRPRKVVCRHKKGTWERRKEKDQGRREGGSTKARFCVSSTKTFFFWFTSIWVWKRPISFEVSAPTRLSLQGSHVQRKFRKRTTLCSKSSTLKGLLYAGWRSHCEAFVVRKGRTIALEQSVSKKAVKDKRQSTFFSRVGYPWWFLFGLYCVALLTQESVSSRIFVRRNEKPTRSEPETWGRMYKVLALRN
jgi:hypothetical protein